MLQSYDMEIVDLSLSVLYQASTPSASILSSVDGDGVEVNIFITKILGPYSFHYCCSLIFRSPHHSLSWFAISLRLQVCIARVTE